MTTKAQARARDRYNSKTKSFYLRFREDELALYEKLSREEAPGALIKELLEKHYFGPEKEHWIAYGEGDAGMYTLYGMGDTPDEAKRDSVQYGYDPDRQKPWLFVERISDKAYNYIKEVGCNDFNDPAFRHEDGILKMRTEV